MSAEARALWKSPVRNSAENLIMIVVQNIYWMTPLLCVFIICVYGAVILRLSYYRPVLHSNW